MSSLAQQYKARPKHRQYTNPGNQKYQKNLYLQWEILQPTNSQTLVNLLQKEISTKIRHGQNIDNNTFTFGYLSPHGLYCHVWLPKLRIDNITFTFGQLYCSDCIFIEPLKIVFYSFVLFLLLYRQSSLDPGRQVRSTW